MLLLLSYMLLSAPCCHAAIRWRFIYAGYVAYVADYVAYVTLCLLRYGAR